MEAEQSAGGAAGPRTGPAPQMGSFVPFPIFMLFVSYELTR